MGIKLLTAPAMEPVSLDDAKAHLKVDNDSDDIYIAALIPAARWFCEGFMRRAFFTQQWQLSIDHFPGAHDYNVGFWDYGVLGDAALGLGLPPVGYTYEFKSEIYFRAGQIVIPWPPLISIDSFTYLDFNGDTQSLTQGTDYQVDLISEPGRIAPAPNSMWPLTLISVRAPVLNAVNIQFTSGFGAGTVVNNADGTTSVGLPAGMPATIPSAIKLLLGHWYENRESVITGLRAAAIEVPFGLRSLLWMDRVLTVA